MKRTVRPLYVLLLLLAVGCSVQQRGDGGFRIDLPPFFGRYVAPAPEATNTPTLLPRIVTVIVTATPTGIITGTTAPGQTIPDTPPGTIPGPIGTTIPPVPATMTTPVTVTATGTVTGTVTTTGTPGTPTTGTGTAAPPSAPPSGTPPSTGTAKPSTTVAPTSRSGSPSTGTPAPGTPTGSPATGTPGSGTPTGAPGTSTGSPVTGTPPSGTPPSGTATQEPLPSATPAPAAIYVGNEQSYIEGSTLYVVGEVVNSTGQPVYNVKVIGTFFEGNRVIAAQETLTLLPASVPASVNPFKLTVANAPSNLERYELSLIWDDISIATYERLRTMREELIEGDEGAEIIGEVGNNSGQTMRDIRVVVTLYDETGTTVNAFAGTPAEPTLESGASTAYTIQIPAGVEFESYLVQSQGMLAVQ